MSTGGGAEGWTVVDPSAFVASLQYKPGWKFKVAGPLNGSLCIFATTPDSHNPARERTTQHMFPLPMPVPAPEFARWVFDCLLLCELHEAGEFFMVGDRRPFFPHHQDEGSPYELVVRWTEGGPDGSA